MSGRSLPPGHNTRDTPQHHRNLEQMVKFPSCSDAGGAPSDGRTCVGSKVTCPSWSDDGGATSAARTCVGIKEISQRQLWLWLDALPHACNAQSRLSLASIPGN